VFSIRMGAALLAATVALAQSNQTVRWEATYTPVYSEPAGGTAATLDAGLQLVSGGTIVTDPALALPGSTSVHLKNYGGVATNPAVVRLSGNTTYIIEFKYRILNYGSNPAVVVPVYLFPVGSNDQQQLITVSNLVKSAPVTGVFSAGAQTANASQYYFEVTASSDSDVVINDIKIFRQDPVQRTTAPATWSALEGLPFPRLGIGLEGTTSLQTRDGMLPYEYSVDQLESRLAFHDVIAELEVDTQTRYDPATIRRLRQLNPSAVILPYRISEEEEQDVTPPLFAQVSLSYPFFQAIPNAWYGKDTAGNFVTEDNYPRLRLMNISPFCPLVNGQTYVSALLGWLNGKMFPSGLWDGVFLDNFFARANLHLANLSNPALFNFDWNGNGIRDETAASTSEMTRNAAIGMLQQFRATNGDLQLVIGNAGTLPELPLAPYMNGSYFECIGDTWNIANPAAGSTAAWRGVFDAYRTMQATTRSPRINLIEGCGAPDRYVRASHLSETIPTADDLRMHRMTLGTALLSDGFYSFDIFGQNSTPLWYDEYSVDAQGNAVEDRAMKGYLGAALADAAELTDGGAVVLQESFDGAALPAAFRASPAGSVSVANGVLTIGSADHTQNARMSVSTNPNALALGPGMYLLTFDWKVIDTLDQPVQIDLTGSTQSFSLPWVISGDSGTVHFPVTIPTGGSGALEISTAGGGKVALDNLRIVRGGVGPWRRDFENGFVLVNPLPQAYTFSAAEVAGVLHRTGIHRIKGTQAPAVNNGQAVPGEFTLGPFDAMILLANPIPFRAPVITGVSNAAGGQAGVGSGALVSIYGSNFTPLASDDWGKSIANGRLPTQLDGVRVSVGGRPAYVAAITPGQINVQAPDQDASGPVAVVVTTPGGASAAFTAPGQLYSPAFFPLPGNQPVATHADYSIAAQNGTFSRLSTVAAKPGEAIILWGTGFGPTNPTVPAGQQPAVLAPPTATPVSVTLGGTAVSVLGAVLSSYAATYQIAIQIPASMADGDYAIVASVGGAQSPGNLVLAVRR
jgi:uncharacterized protein (TIGR03437 family)